MEWYFDPLPKNEKSSIDIRLSNVQHQLGKLIRSNELYEKLLKMRPHLSHQYGVRSQAIGHELFGPSPVTYVVYDWLAHDLRDISWMS
jgi:hypothetical protein